MGIENWTLVATIIGSLANFAVAYFTFKAANSAKESAIVSKRMMEIEQDERAPKLLVKEVVSARTSNFIEIVNINDKLVYDLNIKFSIYYEPERIALDEETIAMLSPNKSHRIYIPKVSEIINKKLIEEHNKSKLLFVNIDYTFRASDKNVVEGSNKLIGNIYKNDFGEMVYDIKKYILR